MHAESEAAILSLQAQLQEEVAEAKHSSESSAQEYVNQVDAEAVAAMTSLQKILKEEFTANAKNSAESIAEETIARVNAEAESALIQLQKTVTNEKTRTHADSERPSELAASTQNIIEDLQSLLEEEMKSPEIERQRGPDLTRLMIYSSDTPDIDDFAQMVKCQKARYEFDTDSADRLLAIIDEAVAANDGQKLKSIALACHGPPPDADGDIDESEAAAGAAEEQFYWPITKSVVVQDDTELLDVSNPARQLMDALGNAVQDGTGRVDLLACSLLKSREGREVFEAIERETKCNFAASDDVTGNLRDGGDWVMESDNVDIRDDYFHNTDEFSGTFAAHSKNEGGIDAEEVARRIEEAKAEALRMAADDHKAQMDALEETVRQSVEAEKAAALEALRIEHDEKARNLEDEVMQRAENEKVAALEAQRAEHESHMEAELLKSQEVFEKEKMAALAAQQAEHSGVNREHTELESLGAEHKVPCRPHLRSPRGIGGERAL